jgi:hypothetical protein
MLTTLHGIGGAISVVGFADAHRHDRNVSTVGVFARACLFEKNASCTLSACGALRVVAERWGVDEYGLQCALKRGKVRVAGDHRGRRRNRRVDMLMHPWLARKSESNGY